MQQCFAVAITVALSCTAAQPAWAFDVDDGDSDAIAEILAADAVTDDTHAMPTRDQGRWALHDALLRGFAQTPTAARQVTAAVDPLVQLRDEAWLDAIEREALLARVRGNLLHQGREAAARLRFDIPLADHPLVDTYIDYFSGRGRWFFERWLARADRYIPLMRPILAKKGVPEDLVYLAMIESGFSSRAVSSAAACGFWQFIASTGRLFKLKSDTWVDERRDFVRATEAAADYLARLYAEFGDWHLAWAGYNAGEGRVRRALTKYKATDFWTLVDEHPASLPKETRHYVPKIIAAAIVAKDRKKYGFQDVESEPPLAYDSIEVNEATALLAVAEQLKVPLDTLRELNPSLLNDVTPPRRRSVLRVPKGRGEEVLAWLSSIPKDERLSYQRHIVKRGDTLYALARRFGTTAVAIRELNGMAPKQFIRVGQKLVIPAAKERSVHGRNVLAAAPRPRRARPSRPRPKPIVQRQPVASHRVSAGETFWSIAQRYGVSVDNLKRWNGRHSNQLIVGEVLHIYERNES